MFCPLFMACPLFGMSAIGRFHCIQFSDGCINIFCLMLWRGVYPYKYMDSRERFNKTSMAAKKEFYSNLTMKTIIDANNRHIK